MSHGGSVCTFITCRMYRIHISYGTHLLDHLTTDGTGFTAGKLTVVTLVELYTNLP